MGGPRRIEAIDSLRGIAAAAVVGMHVTLAAGLAPIQAHWAVILFFVLSGFVLALPWVAGKPPTWTHFLIRRVCRLSPPAVVAVLLSAALFEMIGARAPYYIPGWGGPLTVSLLTRCLLLTGQHGGCGQLDAPLWSLVYEFRVSAIFPVIMFLALRRGLIVTAVIVSASAIVEVAAWQQGVATYSEFTMDGLAPGLLLTLHYGAMFLFGILLAVHRDRIIPLAGRYAPLFLVGSIAALALPSDLGNGIGATLLIAVLIVYKPVACVMSWAPLRWLGRVSYSLYVIHMVVILALFHGVGNPFTAPEAFAAVAVSAMVAELMYRLVEAPSIHLARWLTGTPRSMPPDTGYINPQPMNVRAPPSVNDGAITF